MTRTAPALAPETEAAPRWGTLCAHWPEYLSELGGLAWVMLAAGTIAAVIWYPGSPVGRAVTAEPARRVLMGVGMASAVVAFVYSPWGKRSGAHLNPAITLSFLFLGKIRARDAAFYIGAQFCGAVLGMLLFAGLAGAWASDSHVNYLVTVPGQWGASAAFAAELGITFAMMTLVLMASNLEWLRRLTGVLAGLLLAILITFESPISGTSLNPARSFGSAAVAREWTALWIYLTAPTAGALLASLVYARGLGWPVYCAKLQHPFDRQTSRQCIFRCGYGAVAEPAPQPESARHA